MTSSLTEGSGSGTQSMAAGTQQDSPQMPDDAVFLFSHGPHTLRTQGVQEIIQTPAVNGMDADSALQQHIRAAFARARAAGVERPIVVGSIPFDTREPSCLYVPAQSEWITGWEDLTTADLPAPPAPHQPHHHPGPAGLRAGRGPRRSSLRSRPAAQDRAGHFQPSDLHRPPARGGAAHTAATAEPQRLPAAGSAARWRSSGRRQPRAADSPA